MLTNELELCQKFLSESRYHKVTLDSEKCLRIINNLKSKPDFGFVEFLYKDGKIVGMFLGYLERLFFSNEIQSRDLVFYVYPEYRGSAWIIRTIKKFEQWSKDHGAKYIELLHNTGINTDSAQGLFKRLGYDLCGYVFNKEL